MPENFVIIIPQFNDWEALNLLIEKINADLNRLILQNTTLTGRRRLLLQSRERSHLLHLEEKKSKFCDSTAISGIKKPLRSASLTLPNTWLLIR